MKTQVEKDHVQDVYEHIADHFSHTRYKPWPRVDQYIKSLPNGSIMIDVGCGNGKYLNSNPNLCSIGCDQSIKLIQICKSRGFECLIADGLKLCYRSQCSDVVICIAVMHHYSTIENRLRALLELKRIAKIGGHILLTCWALEHSKYMEQDVMIKWHLPNNLDPKFNKKKVVSSQKKEKKHITITDRHHLSHHLRTSRLDGEIEKDAIYETETKQAQDSVSQHFEKLSLDRQSLSDLTSDSPLLPLPNPSYPKENTEEACQNSSKYTMKEKKVEAHQIFERYYHLFQKGELDGLAKQVGGLDIIESLWDVDNWYLLLKRIS